MKNTPADFEHAAELLAENTRLRAALAERARKHEAALADIEKAQTDIGRLRIWHERALDERDATRAERDEAVAVATEAIHRFELVSGSIHPLFASSPVAASLRARLSALGKPASGPSAFAGAHERISIGGKRGDPLDEYDAILSELSGHGWEAIRKPDGTEDRDLGDRVGNLIIDLVNEIARLRRETGPAIDAEEVRLMREAVDAAAELMSWDWPQLLDEQGIDADTAIKDAKRLDEKLNALRRHRERTREEER